MTPLGEKILEFLRSQPDVTEVRDESTATISGAVQDEYVFCRHRGANYHVAVAQGYPH